MLIKLNRGRLNKNKGNNFCDELVNWSRDTHLQVSRLKSSDKDLSPYLNHRHHLLCDVPDETLLKFLALSKFCLNSDLLVEAKEVK